MTALPDRQLLRDRIGRSLFPNRGARANAADSLREIQQTRRVRAEAVEAATSAAPPSPDGVQSPARSTR